MAFLVVCSLGFSISGDYFATTCRDLQVGLRAESSAFAAINVANHDKVAPLICRF